MILLILFAGGGGIVGGGDSTAYMSAHGRGRGGEIERDVSSMAASLES